MADTRVKPKAAVRRFDIFMRPDFYRRVFSPAVRQAFGRGEPYEAIRHSLRASWKPAAK